MIVSLSYVSGPVYMETKLSWKEEHTDQAE